MIHKFKNTKVVLSKHLNHHNTLFAGIIADWFVETGFICASQFVGSTHKVVCLRIYDLIIKKGVKVGDILEFDAELTEVGITSMMVKINLNIYGENKTIGDAEIKYVCVDENYKATEIKIQ